MARSQSNDVKRSDAFGAMTPSTQVLAKELESKLDRLNQCNLEVRHEIGTTLKHAIDDQATCGSHTVKQLAAYLGESQDALYKLRSFATHFSCAQIREWSHRKMISGGRLRYNHLTSIMVVESETERLRLVDQTFDESLSVRRLRELISGTGCEKRKFSKGGRKPKTILDGLEQLISRAKALQKGFPVWNAVVFDAIEQADPSNVERVVLNRIVEARNLLDEVRGQIRESESRLAAGFSHLQQLLGSRPFNSETVADGACGSRRTAADTETELPSHRNGNLT